MPERQEGMSRYSSYDDADAKCPYYTGSTVTDVRCEGLVPGQCIIIRFASRDARNAFRAQHCDSMDGYGRCMIKKAHE